MLNHETVTLDEALRALAFVGDLSMGQPVDHSARVAWLTWRMSVTLGLSEIEQSETSQVALLRWVGCTANASDVAKVIDDDVKGRGAELALQPGDIHLLVAPHRLPRLVGEISAIHCDVSVMIARELALSPGVVTALECIFERWDGSGYPMRLQGNAIPLAVVLTVLAGDLEVFARVHGLSAALALLQTRANSVYPQQLVDIAKQHAESWLTELEQHGARWSTPETVACGQLVDLSLIADVIDLKLPWLVGHSRAVSQLAGAVASRLNLPSKAQAHIRRSGLLQGIGRVTIGNALWNKAGPLSMADWEQVRLSPYWTARALGQLRAMQEEAEIASFACERLDGSGYFRAAHHAATPLVCRIIPVATTWLALLAKRPWREAFSAEAAREHMSRQVSLGRFDKEVVAALEGGSIAIASLTPTTVPTDTILSSRERDVLLRISVGDSNKEAARRLGLSPATVRTHMESVFRKLGCNSRAAATLKASRLGLI